MTYPTVALFTHDFIIDPPRVLNIYVPLYPFHYKTSHHHTWELHSIHVNNINTIRAKFLINAFRSRIPFTHFLYSTSDIENFIGSTNSIVPPEMALVVKFLDSLDSLGTMVLILLPTFSLSLRLTNRAVNPNSTSRN